MKFLHQRKKKKTEFVSKGRISEYYKEKYKDKKLQKKQDDKSKFVTKNCFELQFGFDAPQVNYKKHYIKQSSSCGRINGIPIIKHD
tara:strand:- start:166 stop:423 length:258 start_codon:yes stop_codon:yes gene_type:complete